MIFFNCHVIFGACVVCYSGKRVMSSFLKCWECLARVSLNKKQVSAHSREALIGCLESNEFLQMALKAAGWIQGSLTVFTDHLPRVLMSENRDFLGKYDEKLFFHVKNSLTKQPIDISSHHILTFYHVPLAPIDLKNVWHKISSREKSHKSASPSGSRLQCCW